MNAQQFLNHVIDPTLTMMSELGNYNTKSARMLLLATVAIESDMGLYNQQINGPAVSAFQLEPDTIEQTAAWWDMWPEMTGIVRQISMIYKMDAPNLVLECEVNQRLACLIARGKYAMDLRSLPAHNDKEELFNYYKRVFNSANGASNYQKWCKAWDKHDLDEIIL